MNDPNEIAALKSSFRGALGTAAALHVLEGQIENLDPTVDISADVLEALARVSAAHATASAALRGLVVTMLTRRGSTGE
jgi:hypothetical protein